MAYNWIDLKFGKWKVVKELSGKKCLCVCECGNVKEVYKGNLTSGGSVSCGCVGGTFKHGYTKTKIYFVWRNMVERCNNPKANWFYRYGGRGIIVCERWRNFKNFLEDMGDIPFKGAQLNRIDNNSNYCKENCKWSTATENARNKSNTIFLTFENKTLSLMEWSEITGIKPTVLRIRFYKGWDAERILTQQMRYKILENKKVP